MNLDWEDCLQKDKGCCETEKQNKTKEIRGTKKQQ